MHINLTDSSIPIREFQDRGLRWLFEVSTMLENLIQMQDPDLALAIDFGAAVRLNAQLVSDSLRRIEPDVLYKAPIRMGVQDKEVYVFIILENQTTPDRRIFLRLLACMTEIWLLEEREQIAEGVPQKDVILSGMLPIILYSGKSYWLSELSMKSMVDLPPQFERYLPVFEVQFMNLSEMSEETLRSTALGAALRVLKGENLPVDQFSPLLRDAFADLAKTYEGQPAIVEHVITFLLLFVQHRRPEEEQPVLYNVLREVHLADDENGVLEMGMTIAERLLYDGEQKGLRKGIEQGIEKGIEQGIEKGIGKGRLEGNLEEAIKNILLLGSIQCGGQPTASQNEIITSITDLSKAEMLLARVLKISSWEALLEGLKP